MWLIGTPGTWCYRTDLVASGFMTDAQPSLCSTPQPQPSAPLKELLAPETMDRDGTARRIQPDVDPSGESRRTSTTAPGLTPVSTTNTSQ
jgi:hypothetical protein